jgi:hypothetical protein
VSLTPKVARGWGGSESLATSWCWPSAAGEWLVAGLGTVAGWAHWRSRSSGLDVIRVRSQFAAVYVGRTRPLRLLPVGSHPIESSYTSDRICDSSGKALLRRYSESGLQSVSTTGLVLIHHTLRCQQLSHCNIVQSVTRASVTLA